MASQTDGSSHGKHAGMTIEEGVVRSASWRDLCPWTILFRLYRLSVSFQLLLLAFVGAWVTSVGWQFCSAVCLSEESRSQPVVQRLMNSVTDWPDSVDWQSPFPSTRSISEAAPNTDSTESPPVPAPNGAAHGGPLAELWHGWLSHTPLYTIVEPIRRWFDPSISWDQFAFFFFGGMWSLVVWALVGAAITRAAVVRLGRDERVGLRESLEFSSRKLLSTMGAVLLPLAAVFSLGIPLSILGLLMRIDLGVAFIGVLWLPVGLIGFAMALFAVGVMFGWPLMWAAISSEGSDAFDAISRSYAYTYQRPLQYFAYATLALLLGFLGWIIVGLLCQAIIQFSLLAVGIGMGDARLDVLREALSGQDTPDSSTLWFGSMLIGFFNRCFLGLQVAFSYSFMWSAAAAIYLLLRLDADQTEMDDIYLEEDQGVAYGLPPLSLDEAGVPGAQDAEEEGEGEKEEKATE